MRGFKDTNKNAKQIVKVRKNRNSNKDNIRFTLFLKCRREPEFLYEDAEFNIDAELEADFARAM